MARLLRVHFSSIGHADARLAPLTLDFRHAGAGAAEPEGSGADSVLWLRNAGGKSSILNLLYSVFRPSAREFLGASAEGKARRLDQYVKGRDLAFVVTEWDVDPPAATADLSAPPRSVRIVGQLLAWRNQRRSADTANLRRLFFSLQAVEGLVGIERLPIQGLAEPAESYDAFREWLRDLQQRPGIGDVVYTEHQRKWGVHLEQIGLDPELFRYQLEMNRREGAADELFRFRRDEEFVRFLLDVALDPSTADQVSSNLQAQRDNLQRRPHWEIEQRFLEAALAEVRPLAAAARAENEAASAVREATTAMAGTVAELARRSEQLRGEAAASRETAREAAEQARRADNERAKLQRWIRGLERLALQYEVAEAVRALDEARALLDEALLDRRAAEAAEVLRKVRTHEGKLHELQAALERAEAAIQPLLEAARARGSDLWALLDGEHRRASQLADMLDRLTQDAIGHEKEAVRRGREARDAALAAAAEIRRCDDQIARRERARERLLQAGHLHPREAAQAAEERWQRRQDDLAGGIGQNRADRTAARERRDANQLRRTELAAERAKVAEQATVLASQLDEALAWRDRLQVDERILEVEAVDEANLDSPRLEARLRSTAEQAHKQLLDSRVEGAEDRRSLDWLRDHGLLPSPVDVERVIAALAERGISAHAGPAYLEQNLPAERRALRLSQDPARFSGVVVVDEADLAAARALEVERLRAPVQISLLRDLAARPTTDDAHVCLPDPALYDTAAADDERPELEAAVLRREERARRLAKREKGFVAIADELRRFLADHGGGQLDRLGQRQSDLEQQRELATTEIERLEQEARELAEMVQTLEREADRLRAEQERARQAQTAIHGFREEHEGPIAAVRERRTQATADRRAAEEQSRRAEQEVDHHRQRADELRRRHLEQSTEVRAIATERDGLAHVGERRSPPEGLPLDAARSAYETARKQYEGEIRSPEIKARIAVTRETRDDDRRRYDRLARDLDRTAVDRLADRSDLETERERLQAFEHEQMYRVTRHEADLAQARDRLAEASTLARETDDLPADRPRPEDAARARAMAAELAVAAEHVVQQVADFAEQQTAAEALATARDRDADRCDSSVQALRGVAEGADVGLVDEPDGGIALDMARLEEQVERLKGGFLLAHREWTRAQREASRRVEAVHRVAHRTEFLDLRAQYQERMKDAGDKLSADAARLAEELHRRREVVGQALAKLDEDRDLLVTELMHLGDLVHKLLERAQRASVLPSSLEGWAGKPYVRIHFVFPESDEERRARLVPLVDQLVGHAQIPAGVELVFRTAVELAGSRGFQVQILKPDTVLRPSPIPLHLMSTFSRGQQLTAAILLYCTLVQLRARSRGRGHGSHDAGVLILDNPIGTCSNVALLQLQREIAAQMRVQLVYTTGVEDLEALETLPNKVRLRNTHRNRSTGDFHVTEQEPDRGKVEAARLVEVPAR